ncbi:MAG: hypothetical protein U1G07_03305 [Verrucomicrobiota bacterium]
MSSGLSGLGWRSPKGKIIELAGKDGWNYRSMLPCGVVSWRSTEIAKRRELVAFRDQNIEALPDATSFLLDTVTWRRGGSRLSDTEKTSTLYQRVRWWCVPALARSAMATLPSFDPFLTETSPAEQPRSLIWRNRDRLFKIVVISGALNDGTVTLNDQFDCEQIVFVFTDREEASQTTSATVSSRLKRLSPIRPT